MMLMGRLSCSSSVIDQIVGPRPWGRHPEPSRGWAWSTSSQISVLQGLKRLLHLSPPQRPIRCTVVIVHRFMQYKRYMQTYQLFTFQTRKDDCHILSWKERKNYKHVWTDGPGTIRLFICWVWSQVSLRFIVSLVQPSSVRIAFGTCRR